MNKKPVRRGNTSDPKKKSKASVNKTNNKGKKPPIKKVDTTKLTCYFLNEEGKGQVKYGNKTVSVPYLLKDETALVELKSQGQHYNTRIMSIIDRSNDRVEPKCKYFYKCGGCQLQHISDKGQAVYKENTVRNLMKAHGKVEKIITMDNPHDYRNKIQSTFASYEKGDVITGFYQEYTHTVIPIDRCIIQDPRADAILLSIRELAKKYKLRVFNEDNSLGFLRHVLIRTGLKSGEIMVVFVVGDKVFPSKSKFIKDLLDMHPEITTILMNVNNRNTSVVLGDHEQVLYGKGLIEDTLCDLKFQISAKSFYQINPIQTEKLYNKAIAFAELKGDEVVLDAYSGIGTISLIASKQVKEVIGIELNKDSVKNAIVNAKLNKIRNARFYQGDAGEFMVEMAKEKVHVDTVFMDPPRSGSDEAFLSSIVQLLPRQVIYVSCNPVTQLSDVDYLTNRGYKVVKIQPVDMFPQTYHVENIVKLVRK